MRGFKTFAALLCILTGARCLLCAHGINYEIKPGRALTLQISYDDGEPMSYAEVLIFSPENGEMEHQNGRTDKNGVFAFLPDCTGQWKVVANDGEGHGISVETSVAENMSAKPMEKRWDKKAKLLVGVSLIWGFFGTMCYFRSGKGCAK